MTVRDEIHRLVDGLPEEDLVAAQRYCAYLRSGYTDPLLWVLDTASEDDAATTPEDEAALAEARAQARRGETLTAQEAKRTLLACPAINDTSSRHAHHGS